LAESHSDFAARRARFRQYDTSAAVESYVQRLSREWPERTEIAHHITQQIANLAIPQAAVLELCCGPGWLAQTLLTTLPTIDYIGVDISPPFLAFAQAHLALHAARVALVEADLNEAAWPALFAEQGVGGRFHAIVSLQSLHDVGDDAAISRVYGLAKTLLLPGGFFLNADLVVAAGEELPQNPGRRSIARHLELLHAHGYQEPRCTLALGGFGTVIGWTR
jgi:SAM-dependent methyltransferase